MDLDEYISHFENLVELERREEMERHEAQIKSLSGHQRQEKGRALLGMRSRDLGEGLGGYRQIKFMKPPGEPLPDHEIGVGDLVLVSKNEPLHPNNPTGTVTEVTNFSLTASFSGRLPGFVFRSKDLRLDLYVNDITFQRMLDALSRFGRLRGPRNRLQRVLLGKDGPRFDRVEQDISYLNHQLNESQRRAVSKCLAAEDFFLIHGPPGTGKTTTLIEVIRQLVDKGRWVLATADSNMAVDNLVERLADRDIDVVRVGHPARVSPLLRQHTLDYQVEDVPEFERAQKMRSRAQKMQKEQDDLTRPGGRWRRGMSDEQIKSLAKKGAGSRGVPPHRIKEMAQWLEIQKEVDRLYDRVERLEDRAVEKLLRQSHVVCTTNSTAGSELLVQRKFDDVVVDEATQAVEPSNLIALLHADRFFLAGDHQQLPPTILNQTAAERGLARTLFERLLATYSDRVKALLSVQYRMNRKIMNFSNEEFYSGQLKAHESVVGHTLRGILPENSVEELEALDLDRTVREVVQPQDPLAFVDTANLDAREMSRADSPSCENPKEAKIVAGLVAALTRMGLGEHDLAVITPYDDQVQRLRRQLSELENLEINSVDGFQGREKEAVIISFVRSNRQGNLGFLADLRRLNVSLTRARRKLILVGDGNTLRSHETYRRLLEYVGENGVYQRL